MPASKYAPHPYANYLLPPIAYGDYVLDSVGHYRLVIGDDLQFLLRSQINDTDTIWVWIVPVSVSDPVPPTATRTIERQRWMQRQVELKLADGESASAFNAIQDSPWGGWRLHWQLHGVAYHVHVRPSKLFAAEYDLLEFAQVFRKSGRS